MHKKIVIIGSNGLLGQTLVNKLLTQSNFKVVAMAAGENRNDKLPIEQYFAIDISDFKRIKQQLKSQKPHFIINALAMTNVDACEIHRKLCDATNVTFVKKLAKTCHKLRIHLIHISTDFIFDGVQGNYTENVHPNPINYYGLSKLKSEQVIQNTLKNYTILRTILVYGRVMKMKQQNIVLWVKESLEKGKKIRIVDDQFRMPTYVGSLADACLLVVNKKAKGVYHISGSGLLSIYDIALQIAKFYSLPKSLISPICSKELGQKAPRPPKTGFELEKARKDIGFTPLSLEEGLLLFQSES